MIIEVRGLIPDFSGFEEGIAITAIKSCLKVDEENCQSSWFKSGNPFPVDCLSQKSKVRVFVC